MRPLFFVLAWILSDISIAFGAAISEEGSKLWPTCIAQYCFDGKAPQEIDLIKSYGYGTYKKDGEEAWHCYEVPERKLFLKFTIHNDITPLIVGIVVSSEPICKEARRPIKSFKRLNTKEGIAIGDKYEKVIHTYGNPQYVRTGRELVALSRDYFSSLLKIVDSDIAIAYGPTAVDDLLVTWFYFHKGSLAAISMSISE